MFYRADRATPDGMNYVLTWTISLKIIEGMLENLGLDKLALKAMDVLRTVFVLSFNIDHTIGQVRRWRRRHRRRARARRRRDASFRHALFRPAAAKRFFILPATLLFDTRVSFFCPAVSLLSFAAGDALVRRSPVSQGTSASRSHVPLSLSALFASLSLSPI